MSLTSSALPREVAVAAGLPSRRRAAIVVLVAAMVLTTVIGLCISLFFPEGDDGHLTYAAVAPTRTFFRIWLTLAAVNLVVGAIAFSISVWLLVPGRGWVGATSGACLFCLGAALYAAGVGGVAALYYFGTEPAAIDPASGTRLLGYLDDHQPALWAPALVGAVVSLAGQLLLALGLWRAATVPRWIPVLAAAAVVTFVLPTSGVVGVFVELPSALAGLGLAWCLWQARATIGSP